MAWRCDNDIDCKDGSDERQCGIFLDLILNLEITKLVCWHILLTKDSILL